MYFLTIVRLMFVFPVLSVFGDVLIFKSNAGIVPLMGKWFVFWAVGVRLFSAGLRQALTPRFTAEQIFGIKSTEPLVIVQELGFANLSLGALGLSTAFASSWILPAALAGGLFYGFAGLRHLMKRDRNRLENGAMVSDLFVFLVLVIYFVEAVV